MEQLSPCITVTAPVLYSPRAATSEPPCRQLLKLSCPRAYAPRQEKPPQWEARVPQESSPCLLQLEKSLCSKEEPAQPKINTSTSFKKKCAMDEIDILSKKDVQMPINTWKDAQYHYSLEKHKSKAQGHTNSHPLQWLLSKKQQTWNHWWECGKIRNLAHLGM